MLLAIAAVIAGFGLLIWGADRLVTGASALARNLGVAPLLIGLTIVALGTSAPEIFVAIASAWQGNSDLAIGNAIGSNIANIGLVLGACALISPLKVNSQVLRREYPLLFLIMLLTWWRMSDNTLGVLDGMVLLAGLAVLITWLIWMGYNNPDEPMALEFDQTLPKALATPLALGWLLVGLLLLPLGSHILVGGAVKIANFFGVSDLIIGLTMLAIGTSLPELAAGIVAAIKGEHDIAIGNILGSNMFNLLAVLPFPALINPSQLDPETLSRDLPVMFGITALLFMFAYGFRGPGKIKRWEGGVLLLFYIAYLGFLTR